MLDDNVRDEGGEEEAECGGMLCNVVERAFSLPFGVDAAAPPEGVEALEGGLAAVLNSKLPKLLGTKSKDWVGNGMP